MGYHKRKIIKGVLGEFSKIKEEFMELEDAHEQGCSMLILCELSDLMGAIESYIEKNNLSLQDLIQFSNMTKSAFKEGKRK